MFSYSAGTWEMAYISACAVHFVFEVDATLYCESVFVNIEGFHHLLPMVIQHRCGSRLCALGLEDFSIRESFFFGKGHGNISEVISLILPSGYWGLSM